MILRSNTITSLPPDPTPAIVHEFVRTAFKIAESEKPGATQVELPEDVATETTDTQQLLARDTVSFAGPNPAFVAFAESVGIDGYRPESPPELHEVFESAIGGVMTLAEIPVERRVPSGHTYQKSGEFHWTVYVSRSSKPPAGRSRSSNQASHLWAFDGRITGPRPAPSVLLR